MALYDLPNSTGGIDDILVGTVSSLSIFTPLLLLFIFFTVTLGGITRQIVRNGTADYSMWVVIGCLSTFITATIMTTITGIIRLDYYMILIALTIISGVWFFLDRKVKEV